MLVIAYTICTIDTATCSVIACIRVCIAVAIMIACTCVAVVGCCCCVGVRDLCVCVWCVLMSLLLVLLSIFCFVGIDAVSVAVALVGVDVVLCCVVIYIVYYGCVCGYVVCCVGVVGISYVCGGVITRSVAIYVVGIAGAGVWCYWCCCV